MLLSNLVLNSWEMDALTMKPFFIGLVVKLAERDCGIQFGLLCVYNHAGYYM